MSEKFRSETTECERQEATNLHNFLVDKSIDHKELLDRYSQTSDKYDKLLNTIVYTGAIKTGTTLAELFPHSRENYRLLDVAAGTGLCGVEFVKHGFKQMDALDGSSGMLKEAEKKGIYGRLFHHRLGDTSTDIESDTYDAISICNFCIEVMRNLPQSCFTDLIRLVKPGGYIVITSFLTTFDKDNVKTEDMRGKFADLELKGKWKRKSMCPFPEYLYGHDGGVLIHQVC